MMSTRGNVRGDPGRFTYFTEVESHSHPGKMYQLKQDSNTGWLTCACMAWRFQHLPTEERVCKHSRPFLLEWGLIDYNDRPTGNRPRIAPAVAKQRVAGKTFKEIDLAEAVVAAMLD